MDICTERGAAEAARGARPAAAQAAESAGAGAGAGARTETSESARAAVKKGGMSLDVSCLESHHLPSFCHLLIPYCLFGLF